MKGIRKPGVKHKFLWIMLLLFINAGETFAAHPLITDDAGTQGKGKFQLEINGQYGRDSSDGVVQYTTPTASTLTYGLSDSVDVSVGMPYIWIKTDDHGTNTHHDGFGDVALALKWRFYEKNGLSFALKPGLTLPTGDKDKQLGTGRTTYSLFFIATKEFGPWKFHANLGYIGNENDLNQRVPLWHASLASEVEVLKNLRLVVNTGIQRNTEKRASTDPAFLLGGVIYSVSEHFDIDAGYKYGLTKPEVDHTVLAGITFRF